MMFRFMLVALLALASAAPNQHSKRNDLSAAEAEECSACEAQQSNLVKALTIVSTLHG